MPALINHMIRLVVGVILVVGVEVDVDLIGVDEVIVAATEEDEVSVVVAEEDIIPIIKKLLTLSLLMLSKKGKILMSHRSF